MGPLIRSARIRLREVWAYGARRGPEMGQNRFLGDFGLVARLRRAFLGVRKAHGALRGPEGALEGPIGAL